MDSIRERTNAGWKGIVFCGAVFLGMGILFGLGSKYLDASFPFDQLPTFMQSLNLSHITSLPAAWVFLGVVIGGFSGSPFRGAFYAAAFCVGFMVGFYIYAGITGGPSPWSDGTDWIRFIGASALLAVPGWLARGESVTSIAISSCILAVLFNQAFLYGAFYFGLMGILELLIFLASLVVLKREKMIAMLILALALAIAIHDLPLLEKLPFLKRS